MLFHLDYDGNGNVWTGLTGLMSHRDEAGLLHIWISLTRFTLVEIFHVRKCSRIHQFWSIRIHRLLHWKGVSIPDRLHTTTTPGTFMMKWLTSCLLPQKRDTKSPKKPRFWFRQSEVYFPLAYQAITANLVLLTIRLWARDFYEVIVDEAGRP